MPQKIIDIFPPGKKDLQELHKETEQGYSRTHSRLIKTPKFFKKGVFLLFLMILVLGGIFAYVSLPMATVEIWPETEVLSFSESIEINTETTEPDFSSKVFPGIIFEDEIEVSQDFPSSGRAQKTERAKGIIRVFNAHSQSPQILVANTRFVSADGKLFRLLQSSTIPGGSLDERGKLEPGFLDVEVQAAEAGKDYNIGSSTFSIPGFLGTDKYTTFYGKSSDSMTGGFQGEAPQVTQADLDEARNAVMAMLSEEGVQSLSSKIPSGFVILDDAISQVIVDESSNEFAGEEEENFKLRIKASVKVLAFRKADLEDFARNLINIEITPGLTQESVFGPENFWLQKSIQTESLMLDYSFDSIDWEENKMAIGLNFEAKIYPEINEGFARMAFAGKSEQEVNILVSSQQFVNNVQIGLWPFWVKSVPRNEDKIRINLNI